MITFTVEHFVEIKASQERVWIALRNAALIEHANPKVEAAETLAGDGYSVGSRWRETRLIVAGIQKGQELHSIQEVVANAPMASYQLHGVYETGHVETETYATFVPQGPSTVMTIRADVRMDLPPLPWFVKMLGKPITKLIFSKSTQQSLAAELQAWKLFIESGRDVSHT